VDLRPASWAIGILAMAPRMLPFEVDLREV
jgi:hypothetical protein